MNIQHVRRVVREMTARSARSLLPAVPTALWTNNLLCVNAWNEGNAARLADRLFMNAQRGERLPDPSETNAPYVVSMAAMPSRLRNVWLTIESLMNLDPKPARILLWLPLSLKHDALPPELVAQQARGLEIRFVEEIGPYRKWYYTARDIDLNGMDVLLVDDDMVYEQRVLSPCFQAQAGEMVTSCYDISLWGLHIALHGNHEEAKQVKVGPWDDLRTAIDNAWPQRDGRPWGFLEIPTGCAGTRLPAAFLGEKTLTDKDHFARVAPSADDVWLWGNIIQTEWTRHIVGGAVTHGIDAMLAMARFPRRITQYDATGYQPMSRSGLQFRRDQHAASQTYEASIVRAKEMWDQGLAFGVSPKRQASMLNHPYQIQEISVINDLKLAPMLQRLARDANPSLTGANLRSLNLPPLPAHHMNAVDSLPLPRAMAARRAGMLGRETLARSARFVLPAIPKRWWQSNMLFMNAWHEGAAARLSDRLVVSAQRGERLPDPSESSAPYVVSMAAMPNRLRNVWLVVESLMNLDPKPAKILLWLPLSVKHDTLPAELVAQKARGLEIRFVEEIGPHRKWYYTARDIDLNGMDVLLADDDVLYEQRWMPRCLDGNAGEMVTSCLDVSCWGLHIALHGNHEIAKQVKLGPWAAARGAIDQAWPKADSRVWGFLEIPAGGAGVRLPEAFLRDKILTDKDRFTRVSPSADDVWIWGNIIRTEWPRHVVSAKQTTGLGAILAMSRAPRRMTEYGMLKYHSTNRKGGVHGASHPAAEQVYKEAQDRARTMWDQGLAFGVSPKRQRSMLNHPYSVQEISVIDDLKLAPILQRFARDCEPDLTAANLRRLKLPPLPAHHLHVDSG